MKNNSFILFVLFLIFIVFVLYNENKKQSFNEETALSVYQKWNAYAKKYGAYFKIPTNLILSIIAVESGGNENAIGPTSDYGLMQLTKVALADFLSYWKKGYTVDDLFTPYVNIEVGAGYLAILKSRWKDKYSDYWRFYNSGDNGYSQKVTAYLNFYNSKNIY